MNRYDSMMLDGFIAQLDLHRLTIFELKQKFDEWINNALKRNEITIEFYQDMQKEFFRRIFFDFT